MNYHYKYSHLNLEKLIMTEKYEYIIKGRKLPVILMVIMTLLFGSLTIWTYKTNNSVSTLLCVFTLLMLFVFILTVHRLLFFKVLIGLDGFYYQTHIGNGKFYTYKDVEKAWISSGKTQNGIVEHYCNISLKGNKVIRIPFQVSDEKGVNYLIKKVTTNTNSLKSSKTEKTDTYVINGKAFGKARIFLGLLILAAIAFGDILIIKESGFIFIIIPSIIIGIMSIFFLFSYYLWFIVKIEKDGFYCRTTPFNGQYYKYSQITDCRIVQKVVRHHNYNESGSIDRACYFFFVFHDITGKKHVFQFEDQIHEYEINILKERIDAAHI